MRKLVPLLAAVLVLAPIPAHATTPSCQAVAGDVSQIPNGQEHFTMLHATGFTTSCPARSYIQVRADIQQLQPDGSWLAIATATSPVKYVNPYCSKGACKTVSVTVDRNPCTSGTFRAVAIGGNTALPPSTNIGPLSTITCTGDPQ